MDNKLIQIRATNGDKTQIINIDTKSKDLLFSPAIIVKYIEASATAIITPSTKLRNSFNLSTSGSTNIVNYSMSILLK